MSAPVILTISPTSGDRDVVLGTAIEIVFDQAIDQTSISETTFSLMGPGQTSLISPSELLKSSPLPATGREYIPGKFTFPLVNKAVFHPEKPLRPHVKYTVLIVGAGAALVRDSVTNLAGEKLSKNVQITFETGEIVGSAPPAQSPLPLTDPLAAQWMRPVLTPAEIVVHPRRTVGNDLSQVIELIFPSDIDLTSFNTNDISVSVEPLVDDPLVAVPDGLTYQKVISGNTITITVSGWPA